MKKVIFSIVLILATSNLFSGKGDYNRFHRTPIKKHTTQNNHRNEQKDQQKTRKQQANFTHRTIDAVIPATPLIAAQTIIALVQGDIVK